MALIASPVDPTAAGVDEVGRGAVAGPVVAAAVILRAPIPHLKDSKQLTPAMRVKLAALIRSQAIAYGIGIASVAEIDRLNVLHASLLAMARAVSALAVRPAAVWVDGNMPPQVPYPVRTIIRGDQTEPAISAASVLAKVMRDAMMAGFDRVYGNYGFSAHKGYPTAHHYRCLQQLGVSAVHRGYARKLKPIVSTS